MVSARNMISQKHRVSTAIRHSNGESHFCQFERDREINLRISREGKSQKSKMLPPSCSTTAWSRLSKSSPQNEVDPPLVVQKFASFLNTKIAKHKRLDRIVLPLEYELQRNSLLLSKDDPRCPPLKSCASNPTSRWYWGAHFFSCSGGRIYPAQHWNFSGVGC